MVLPWTKKPSAVNSSELLEEEEEEDLPLEEEEELEEVLPLLERLADSEASRALLDASAEARAEASREFLESEYIKHPPKTKGTSNNNNVLGFIREKILIDSF